MSKIAKIVLLVVAAIAVMIIDVAIQESNGMGIPAVLKFIVLAAIIAGIVKVAKNKPKEE